jgi:beta-lactamase regulating signal transducer with metallopeptidase domain
MSGFMDSALFLAVMDTAIRGTFILLAALAGTALMRRNSAAARHLVWLAALTALLLLPIARGFVPEWRVLPAAPVFAAPAALPPAQPVSAPLQSGQPAVSAAPAFPSVAESRPAPFRIPVDWQTLALLAWAAGVAVLALRLAYGLVRVQWIERRATELTDDGWVRLTDGLARRLGLGRIVRLLREPGATVPMTWGVFRPVILLPREADGWDDERRRVVLAHELAHVRRWDALTQWIAHLALAVYWFNPLVWVAVRKLREEREHACDDAVLEIGTRPAEYADHLLNIVRSLGSSHGTTAAALAMARRSQFEGRLLAILDNAVRRNGVSRAAGLATAAAAVACLVPLAALRPAVGAAAPPPAAESLAQGGRPAEGRNAQGAPAADKPVQRIAGKVDEARRGGEAPLAEERDALTAKRDTLDAERAALSVRLSALDARASALRGAAADNGAAALVQAVEEGGDPGLYAEIIRAALDIRAAGERRIVLTRVLEQGDVSTENVVAILAATRTMDSDSERRIVITRALEHRAYPVREPAPAVLVESLRGFRSATEQRIVLTALLERRSLDTPSLASILRVVQRMNSDTERRIVLMAAAERQRVEGVAREAYLDAARAIESEREQALALSALMRGTAAAPAGARPGASTPRPTTLPGVTASPSRTQREAGRGERVWTSSNEYVGSRDGRRLYVRINARDVIVGETLWDVRGLRTGGSLLVEEQLDGRTRRVEATCDGAGNPVWSYTVDGEPRAFDAAAKRWMESVIRRPS